MRETAVFVGWGGVIPGREAESFADYEEFVKILEEAKEKGDIEDFEFVALGPHGGELNGFALVFGDEMSLMQFTMRDDVHRLQLRAGCEFAKFIVVPALTGTRYEQEMKRLQEEILPTFEHAHA